MNTPQIKNHIQLIDIVLIGTGIMSATLATLIKILEPNWNIHIYERLKQIGKESSNAWNNAGTGHAAFCELNYTSKDKNKNIDISKAIKINEEFEISRQLWAYLVKNNFLHNPQTFINNVPHMSFVWGDRNIEFLQQRFHALQKYASFSGMQYSKDPKQIQQWAPLIMDGRDPSQKVAATYMETGTDIDFGNITKQLITKLKSYSNFYLYLEHNVKKIKKNKDKTWLIDIINNNKQKISISAKTVFIGAGGASLPLLQTIGIQEIKGYAGFPVGGQFLLTNNQTIIKKHTAKIYGQTTINTPPMSVPHMDTRIINGNKFLLFGPFATFSGKFLKYGSHLDILRSLKFHNLLPILEVTADNPQLIKYLIKQLIMSRHKKLYSLQKYYPQAKAKDWNLFQAGQRVQIIKKDNKNRGILQFGTEIITTSDGTLSALLGASPGASTSASIILQILKKMFKKHMKDQQWTYKLKKIIPSHYHTHNNDALFTNKIKKYVCNTLKLQDITIIDIKNK